MAKNSEIRARITADATDFSTKVAKSEAEAKRFGKSIESIKPASFGKIALAMGGVQAAFGLATSGAHLAKEAFDEAAELESLVNALASVSDGSETLSAQLTQLREVAKLPGLGFPEAVKGSAALQAVGYSAKQSRDILMQFGNAIAASGGGKQQLDGVITALAQIQGRGKVTADNINQIANAFPGVRAQLKATFGTSSTDTIQGMGMSVSEFTNKLVENMASMKRVDGGMKNAAENVADNWKKALAVVGFAGESAFKKIAKEAYSIPVPVWLQNMMSGGQWSSNQLTFGDVMREAGEDADKYVNDQIAKKFGDKTIPKEEKLSPEVERRAAQDRIDKALYEKRVEEDIAKAKAAGDDARVLSLKTELDLRKNLKSVMDEMSLSEEQATDLIRERNAIQARIEGIDKKKKDEPKPEPVDEEKKRRIRTRSKEESDINQFYRNRSLTAYYGEDYNKFKRYEKSGDMTGYGWMKGGRLETYDKEGTLRDRINRGFSGLDAYNQMQGRRIGDDPVEREAQKNGEKLTRKQRIEMKREEAIAKDKAPKEMVNQLKQINANIKKLVDKGAMKAINK